MPLGVSDDGHGAYEQQLPQIAVSLLGDPTEAFLAAARVLARFVLGAASLLGVYILVPFALLIVAGVVQAARLPTNEKRKLPIAILILPMFWLFAALWGGFFFIEPNRGVQPDWVAAWVGIPLLVIPVFYVIACFVIALRFPESGLFLLPYLIVNLYFVITVSFISMMAVGGTWL